MTTQSIHIAIYGVIAATPVSAKVQASLFMRIKYRLKLQRDLLRCKYGSKPACDYRDYAGATAYNVGDVAIAETIRQLFLDIAPACTFTNVDWGNIESLRAIHQKNKIDLLVVAGSGYFQLSQMGELARHVHEDQTFLESTEIDYAFLGVGINQPFSLEEKGQKTEPDQASKALIRRLLSGARLVSVRDEYSLHTLTAHTDQTIHLIGDPALHVTTALSLPITTPKPNTVPLIGLNFSFHGPTSNKLLLENLPSYAAALHDIRKKTRCRFRYIVHHGAEYPIPHLLKQYGLDLETVYADLPTTSNAYQDLDLHIGGMLHSCILSASADTPWIAIAYDIKHHGFNSIMGMADYYQDATHFEAGELSDLVEQALKENSTLRKKIAMRRESLHKNVMHIVKSLATSKVAH